LLRRLPLRRRLGIAVLVVAAVRPAAGAGLLDLSASDLARAREAARERVEARSHHLYLVLDPPSRCLDLKVDGLLLHRFRASEASFGVPWLAAGKPAWPALRFRLVTELPALDRPQIPIKSGGPDADLPVATALERMPTHYPLVFDPPLEVVVLGQAGALALPGRLWRLRQRLSEGWENLAHRLRHEPVTPRVLFVLPPDEARRLLLSLRPATTLLIRETG